MAACFAVFAPRDAEGTKKVIEGVRDWRRVHEKRLEKMLLLPVAVRSWNDYGGAAGWGSGVAEGAWRRAGA